MGTGQMLLTIGAVILLGNIILTTNRGIANSSQLMLKTNFGLEAVSLASSTVEEAESLPFDESTRFNSDTSTSQLTAAANLGEESSSGDTLDDFDDYNGPPNQGYRIASLTLGTGIYDVKTHVCYVTPSNLTGSSSTPTWHKRIDVWVWNTADTKDTIEVSSVYSYWYFR